MSASEEQERLTLVGSRSEVFEEGQRAVKRLYRGFMAFACSGNILQIAFGMIIASAFTSITTSFVSDILLPPLSVLFPLHKNLEEKFAVLRRGPNYGDLAGYNTLDQARQDGAVILAYGVFLNRCFNFLGLGLAIYALANMYECVSPGAIFKHDFACPYCMKVISPKASRCFNCTSWIDGRERRHDSVTMTSPISPNVRKPYRDNAD